MTKRSSSARSKPPAAKKAAGKSTPSAGAAAKPAPVAEAAAPAPASAPAPAPAPAAARRRLLVVAALGLVLLGGVAWAVAARGGLRQSPAVSTARGAAVPLQPVPTPATLGLDPDVVAQLVTARQAFDAVAGQSGVPSAELGQAYGELAKLYLAYELPGAEAALEDARALLPDDYRWPYLLAQLRSGQGRADDAIAFYKDALRLAPDDMPTQLHLAEVYLDAGKPDDAEPLVNGVLAGKPDLAWVHVLAGRLAAARADPKTAVTHFERALALEPQARIVNRLLAAEYRKLGDAEKSAALLAKGDTTTFTIIDPLSEEVQNLRTGANVYVRQAGQLLATQPQAALDLLLKAEQQDPQNVEMYVLMAQARRSLGDQAGALAAAQRAAALAPSGASGGLAQYTLGLISYEMGDATAAEAALRRSVELAPDDAKAWGALASLLRRSDRCAEAIAPYEAQVARDPKQAVAQVELAMCLVSAGRARDARTALEAAQHQFPTDANIADGLARVLAAAPDPAVRDGAQALALAKAGLQGGPSIDKLDSLAMATAATGDFATAVKIQQDALRLAAADAKQGALWSAWLQGNLVHYQHGEPAAAPWPEFAIRH